MGRLTGVVREVADRLDRNWEREAQELGWDDPVEFVTWLLGWDALDLWQATWVKMITGRKDDGRWINANLCIMCGPRTGKTEIALACLVWEWFKDPTLTCLLVMVNQQWVDQSIQMLKDMVDKVEGAVPGRLRIDANLKNTNSQFTLVRHSEVAIRAPSIYGTTTMSALPSVHVDRIILDDPQSYRSTRSKVEREKSFQSSVSQALKRRRVGTQVLVVCHAWHRQDIGHLTIAAGFESYVGSSHKEDVGKEILDERNELMATVQLAIPYMQTREERDQSEKLDPVMHKILERSDASVRGGGLVGNEAIKRTTDHPMVDRYWRDIPEIVEWDGEGSPPMIHLSKRFSGYWFVLGIDLSGSEAPGSSHTAVAFCWVVKFPGERLPHFLIMALGKWRVNLGDSLRRVSRAKSNWGPTYAFVESSGGDTDASKEVQMLADMFRTTPLEAFNPGSGNKGTNIWSFARGCHQGRVIIYGDGPLVRELVGQIRDLADETNRDYGDLVSAVLAAWWGARYIMKRTDYGGAFPGFGD